MKNNIKAAIIEFIELFFLILVVLIIAGLCGCNKDNPVQPAVNNTSNNLSFSSVSGNSLSNINPENLLIIKEAKVMIKNMKLEIENTGHNEENEETFKTGPFIINLKMDSKVNLVTNSQIPSGNYEKVKFEIHKLLGNEVSTDSDFSDAVGRYSVIVKGKYNGSDFIYKSKISAIQKINLQKTLVITSGKAFQNITFYAEPLLWFYDDDGNIIDPTLESNRHFIDRNIKENIRNNIRLYIDDDHDGRPDN